MRMWVGVLEQEVSGLWESSDWTLVPCEVKGTGWELG